MAKHERQSLYYNEDNLYLYEYVKEKRKSNDWVIELIRREYMREKGLTPNTPSNPTTSVMDTSAMETLTQQVQLLTQQVAQQQQQLLQTQQQMLANTPLKTEVPASVNSPKLSESESELKSESSQTVDLEVATPAKNSGKKARNLRIAGMELGMDD